jgi:hypothetical protein
VRTLSRALATRIGVTAAATALLATVPLAPSDAAVTRPFAATSPFNVAIKASPRLDPASSAMVARATRDRRVYANLYEYGIPIYTATSTTPRYSIPCAMEGDWGRCPLSSRRLPVPTKAKPSTGSDGAMVVIEANGTLGEYWQARRTSTGWKASWGAVNTWSGSGWSGASTGAGASRLGGVIRVSEIKAGVINHALVVQSDNVCARVFRAPAIKTDGNSTRTDCIPEGARLQLDPKIDVNRIPGITPAERTVARALQRYGAYVIDRGGAPLSMSFERAPDATASSPGAVYKAAGLGWDYYGMSRIPWTKLRVLKTWQG